MNVLFRWLSRALRALGVILISILIALILPSKAMRADEPSVSRVSTAARMLRVETQMEVVEGVIGDLVSKVALLQSSVERLELRTSSEHFALTQLLKSEVLRLQSELANAQQEQLVLRREVTEAKRNADDKNIEERPSRKSASSTTSHVEGASGYSGSYRTPAGEIIEIEQIGNELHLHHKLGANEGTWIYRQEIGRPFFVCQGKPPSMVDSGIRYGATSIVLMPIAGNTLKFVAMLKDYRRPEMRLRDYHEPLERLD